MIGVFGAGKVLFKAKRSILINIPRKFQPKFIFFPNFSYISFIGMGDFFAFSTQSFPLDWLSKSYPCPPMCFVTGNIMTFS